MYMPWEASDIQEAMKCRQASLFMKVQGNSILNTSLVPRLAEREYVYTGRAWHLFSLNEATLNAVMWLNYAMKQYSTFTCDCHIHKYTIQTEHRHSSKNNRHWSTTEMGNTIPQLSTSPILVLAISILGSSQFQYDTLAHVSDMAHLAAAGRRQWHEWG